jgi:MoaA/NifB/PqqE/SkfB family radical SAM enzyme
MESRLALSLLEKIRPHNPVLNFTGGEPLLHPQLQFLIQKAKELQFYPIILSTNGLLIEKIIDILPLVDHLVISLDSLNADLNDMLFGASGVTQDIIANIKRCASLSRGSEFHMSLHSVISPETLGGIEDIVSFCELLGITMSVSPEHGRYYPHSGLFKNPDYARLIDRLVELKKRRNPIACSFGYLRKIRDFDEHRCYPFVSPRVEPDGRVYFPCQRIKERYVYLQDYTSLYKLMQEEADCASLEDCARRCFLACYLDVEGYIRDPFSLIKEFPIREWVFGRKSRLKGKEHLERFL